jgi:lysophospholipase L1-like esterase
MGAILCFGDSITFGQDYNGGWCGYLKRWFETPEKDNLVYNLGICGDTTFDLIERFDIESNARIWFEDPTDKYTTLIAIGANDCKYKQGASPENVMVSNDDFANNIDKLIAKASSFKQKVAFIGILPVDEAKRSVPSAHDTVFTNDRVTNFNNIIRDRCKNAGVSFLDMNKIMLRKDYKLLLDDGLHPNLKGHRFVFSKVRTFLKKNDLLP